MALIDFRNILMQTLRNYNIVIITIVTIVTINCNYRIVNSVWQRIDKILIASGTSQEAIMRLHIET